MTAAMVVNGDRSGAVNAADDDPPHRVKEVSRQAARPIRKSSSVKDYWSMIFDNDKMDYVPHHPVRLRDVVRKRRKAMHKRKSSMRDDTHAVAATHALTDVVRNRRARHWDKDKGLGVR